jgi:hypothetical protein
LTDTKFLDCKVIDSNQIELNRELFKESNNRMHTFFWEEQTNADAIDIAIEYLECNKKMYKYENQIKDLNLELRNILDDLSNISE